MSKWKWLSIVIPYYIKAFLWYSIFSAYMLIRHPIASAKYLWRLLGPSLWFMIGDRIKQFVTGKK